MNTTSSDNKNNVAIAETYYRQMLQRNFDAMADCLHPDVNLIGPLAEIYGKNSVVDSAKNLRKILNHIEIHSKFSSENQVMFAYDFIFDKPIGKLRAAVLMDFEDQLISKIELFFDGKPFE